MRFARSAFMWMVTASLALNTAAFAADPAEKGADEEATIKSKISEDTVKSCIVASRVNFQKELGISLDYLDSIGQRIHDARKLPDPVSLALESQRLGVAEKVSGKTASVTATDVLNEAVELAKLRGVATELAAIALIVSDPATKSDLTQKARLAESQEKETRAKLDSGEVQRTLYGTLCVTNHTHECLRIFMDGHCLGRVYAGCSYNFHVHKPNCQNHLDAYCAQYGGLVSHGSYHGHTHLLTWHIHH